MNRQVPASRFARRSVDQIVGSHRARRVRAHDWSRRMIRENALSCDDLVWASFVTDGNGVREPIGSMPGIYRYSPDTIAEEAAEAAALGIPAIAIFAHVEMARRDRDGSHILDEDNVIQRAIASIAEAAPGIGIITDVALDPFTDHGHDGILRDGVIVNDETVERLAEAAIVQARAGSHVIAPSDMMDGRVGAIRDALDGAGYADVAILSYAAKFASAFYGPYREAIGTDQTLKGDKKTYYLDPANRQEALREARQDLAEGADMIMVKPGLPYLDIIRTLKDELAVPTFAYQVSGEYAMIKAAGANGWIDEDRVMMESLLAFKRAGCDGIFTYFAKDAARLLAR